MEYIMLYHGSPQGRALEIIKNGVLLATNCKRIWDNRYTNIAGKNLKTTDGYVYLTDKLSKAAYYGKVATICEEAGDISYFIFRVKIPKKLLLPDLDELAMNYDIYDESFSAEDSLEKCHSVRTDFSIKTTNYEIEYIEIKTRNGNEKILSLMKELSFYRTENYEDPVELVERIGEVCVWRKIEL